MKIAKLMLSVLVAATALVACNKENHTPDPSSNMKSVTLTIDNVSFVTKGANDHPNLAGTKVALNDVKIFFSDGENIYQPKNVDGLTTAQTYFDDAQDLTAANLTFHFLPASVNQVFAIGNKGDIPVANDGKLTSTIGSILTSTIANEQNPMNLTLSASSSLTLKANPTGDHTNHQAATKVYEANLTLTPAVARFEIDKITCNFSATPLFNSVEAIKIAFDNYYVSSDFASKVEMDDDNAEQIFDALTSKALGWDCDQWVSPPSLTPGTGNTAAVNLAYNFFPPTSIYNAYPRFVLQLTTNNNEAAYLMTAKFYRSDNNAELTVTDFQPGYIYKITDFVFNDTDLTHQERCVEITVDVIEWSVVPVYPTFN